jgi:dihydrofolate reductase
VVVTRGPALEGVETISDPAAFDEARYAPREVWLIGGAELYRQLLPRCTDLYLSVLRKPHEGDAFFPEFESAFTFAGVPFTCADFEVRHYTRHT